MKVFLVEDSKVILEHLNDVLSEMQGVHVVATASTEQEAIHGIEEHRPDLVILDLTLAAGSGVNVLRHAKAKYPAASVIVLTNRDAPLYRSRCLSLGADCFLDKSRDFERLRRVVEGLDDAGPGQRS